MDAEVRKYFKQYCPGGKLSLPKAGNLQSKVAKTVRKVKMLSWPNIKKRGHFTKEEVDLLTRALSR